MLVRKQILLEEAQDRQLQQIAYDYSISYSEVVRQSVPLIAKKMISRKKIKKMTGGEFMLQQAKKAVAGPGNSEYDKYAYDL